MLGNGCANLGIAMLRHGNDGHGRAKSGDGTAESCLVKAWTCLEPHWHRKESIRRGIARSSGGRDMQSSAGALYGKALAKHGCARQR